MPIKSFNNRKICYNQIENLYFKNKYFKLKDVVNYLDNNLDVVNINKNIEQKKLY